MGRNFRKCPADSRQAGRAGAWLLLVIAIVGLATWNYVKRGPAPEPQAIAPRADAGIELGAPRQSGAVAGNPSEAPVQSERGPLNAASRFVGTGSLRGLLTTRDGSPPPLPYTLFVGPSGTIEGREYAVLRQSEMHQAEFELKDLPLGGYDAWVNAPGMNSRRSPVLLTQVANSPYIILKVFPTGYLDGYVVNEDGRPAQDLRVELAQAYGEGRRITQTRADGSYLIEDIPDGDYTLSFGPQERPLLPSRDLQFSAPGMHFSKVVLPPTSDIQFWTVDIFGKAIPDVTVRGFSRPGGRIEVVTDGRGHGWARNVPPGKYTLTSQDEEGRKAKSAFVVSGEQNQEFWIAVK